MKMEPMNDMVIFIEEQAAQQETASGIITGVSGLPVAGRGEIYAVPKAWSKEIEPFMCGQSLKKGDTILYSKFAAEEVAAKDENGEDLKGLKSIHVTAVLATYTENA